MALSIGERLAVSRDQQQTGGALHTFHSPSVLPKAPFPARRNNRQSPHRSSGDETTLPSPLDSEQFKFKMTLRLFSSIFLTVLVGVKAMPGGLSEQKKPTPEVQAMITSLKPQVEKGLGREVPRLTLLSYKEQVVQGTNYFAKVDIGEEQVAHLSVYQDLRDKVHLEGVQYPKGRSDPINSF